APGPGGAGPRAGLVRLLRRHLAPARGQPPVRPDLPGREPRHDLLVGHAQAHVAAVAVLQAEHLVLDVVPASGLLPQLGRVEDGHGHLLPADPVHLLPDDDVHPIDHALAEREVDVDPGRQLPDQTGPDHEAVAHRFRVGGALPAPGEERAAPAHAGQRAVLARTLGPGWTGR